ncbi:MAG: hypothetical protein AAGG44_04610, partial [Planctomycetota bacterium]
MLLTTRSAQRTEKSVAAKVLSFLSVVMIASAPITRSSASETEDIKADNIKANESRLSMETPAGSSEIRLR